MPITIKKYTIEFDPNKQRWTGYEVVKTVENQKIQDFAMLGLTNERETAYEACKELIVYLKSRIINGRG